MVAVVVPWRPRCRHREAAWEYVQGLYAEHCPDWQVIEARAPDGPWCKAAAAHPAIESADAEVVIVADADVWCDGLERAVMAVVCGRASWAMPHKKVHRLSEAGTAAVLAGERWEDQRRLEQRAYEGVWGGGIVVAQRDVLLDARLDPRFRSWGQEDTSWALGLQCLYGKGWRGDAPLIHFWHPPQDRLTRQKGSEEGWELYRRYRQARRDPDKMRALISEGVEEEPWPSIAS
jgi:hypothetical protein